MSLVHLNSSRFEEVIYHDGAPCLVIFSRKSCHVCQSVVPVLEDLQPRFDGKFGFYYVDVEEDKVLYQKFSLKGVPQILFFKDGDYQGKLTGKAEEEDIEERITDVLNSES